jgi:hypothetical protein
MQRAVDEIAFTDWIRNAASVLALHIDRVLDLYRA